MSSDRSAQRTAAQDALIDALEALIPGVRAAWDAEQAEFDPVRKSDSLHAVWTFAYRAIHRAVDASVAQPPTLKRITAFLNGEVEAGGDRENAVATCLLEHASRQFERTLRPYLSAETKRCFHA